MLDFIFLSGVAVGAPTLAGSGSWATFLRDLFNLVDYQEIIDDQKVKSQELEKFGNHVQERLGARNRAMEALVKKEISLREAAAFFYHIRNPRDQFVSPSAENFHETTIACMILLKWIQSGGEINVIDCQKYAQFEAEVQAAIKKGGPVNLPLPPAKLVADFLSI
ncbi:MAG: hypothetical protein EXR99_09175 [Gemmataceae bacterium]|nr:hypothetical protein [Gemmataceae bacterium]